MLPFLYFYIANCYIVLKNLIIEFFLRVAQ